MCDFYPIRTPAAEARRLELQEKINAAIEAMENGYPAWTRQYATGGPIDKEVTYGNKRTGT